jgi:hypothetical protein
LLSTFDPSFDGEVKAATDGTNAVSELPYPFPVEAPDFFLSGEHGFPSGCGKICFRFREGHGFIRAVKTSEMIQALAAEVSLLFPITKH